MKDIAWIFKRLGQGLSEKELGELLQVVNKFISEKTAESLDIKAEIQLVQSAKESIEDQLKEYAASAGSAHDIFSKKILESVEYGCEMKAS